MAKSIETKLVNSKKYLINKISFYLVSFFFLVTIALGNNKWNRSLIEQYQIRLFFEDWQTFELCALYLLMVFGSLTAFFGLKYGSHDLGVFKLNEERLYANKTVFPLEKMTQLKFIINSPGVFGTRSSRKGFNNWVSFSLDDVPEKFEFYIENQAMEDEIMRLITESKSRYSIELIVDTKSKESLFESWFGNG